MNLLEAIKLSQEIEAKAKDYTDISKLLKKAKVEKIWE